MTNTFGKMPMATFGWKTKQENTTSDQIPMAAKQTSTVSSSVCRTERENENEAASPIYNAYKIEDGAKGKKVEVPKLPQIVKNSFVLYHHDNHE